MTDSTNDQITGEQLCDMMDNEWNDVDVDTLIRGVHSDSATREKWSRYHLMRDVMQNDYTPGFTAGVLGNDFASKVASAIESEPAIVAFPAQRKQGQAKSGENSNAGIDNQSESKQANNGSDSATQSKVPGLHNWRRNATGLAVAASVAMVSIVGLNMLGDNDTQNAAGVVAGGDSTVVIPALTAGAEQLELVANRGTYWVSTSERSLSQQNEEKLNMFLSKHIENAPSSYTGMLPYSRLVGYDKVRVEQK